MSLTKINSDVMNVPDVSVALADDSTANGIKEYVGRIDTPTTITVGASGANFTTIQAAFDSLNGKRLHAVVTIQVANGTYNQTEIVIAHHPDGHYIKIIGNVSNPSMCVLNFTAAGNGYSSGIQFVNIRKIEFSGFKLIGYYTDSTHFSRQCLDVTNHAHVYSAPNSIEVVGGRIGVACSFESLFTSEGIKITNAISTGFDCTFNSVAYILHADIVGDSAMPVANRASTGVAVRDNSFVDSSFSNISYLLVGIVGTTGGAIYGTNMSVSQCDTAYISNWQATADFVSCTATDCATYGFATSNGGYMNAISCTATRCAHIGFMSLTGSCLVTANCTATTTDYGFYAAIGASLYLSGTTTASNCPGVGGGIVCDVQSVVYATGSINVLNCTNGLVAAHTSSITGYLATVTATGTTNTYTPPRNTVGNVNSVISI